MFRTLRALLLIGAVALLLHARAWAQESKPGGDAPKVAKPTEPEDPSERTAQRLQKPIKAAFSETPIKEALEFIADSCDVDLVVEWPALERSNIITRETTVTLRLKQAIPAEALLRMVLRVTHPQLTHSIDSGVVLISPNDSPQQPAAPEVPATETRVIDVANLLRAGNGVPTAEEQVKQIITLITRIVQPESWRDNGGSVGAIHALGTKLVIRHTEQAQTEIAQLILLVKDK